MQVVQMKMDDVEICRFPEYLFDHEHMVSYGIYAFPVKTQCPAADRDKARIGYRIAAGKQRDLVPHAQEFLGQPRDNTLGTTVQPRRDTFIQRRYLGDSHRLLSDERLLFFALRHERRFTGNC